MAGTRNLMWNVMRVTQRPRRGRLLIPCALEAHFQHLSLKITFRHLPCQAQAAQRSSWNVPPWSQPWSFWTKPVSSPRKLWKLFKHSRSDSPQRICTWSIFDTSYNSIMHQTDDQPEKGTILFLSIFFVSETWFLVSLLLPCSLGNDSCCFVL